MDPVKQPPCSMSTHMVSRYLYHVLSIHYVNIDNTKIKGPETVLAQNWRLAGAVNVKKDRECIAVDSALTSFA